MHLSHPGRSASTFHCVDALIPFAENAQGRLLFRVQPRDALAPCNLRGRRKRAEVEIRSNFSRFTLRSLSRVNFQNFRLQVKFWDPLPRKNERDARPPDFRERRGRGRPRIDRAVLELETSRHRFPCRLRLRPTSPSCLRRRAGSGRDVYPLAHIQGRPLKPNTLHGPGGPRAYAARPYAALGPAPPHIFGCSGGAIKHQHETRTYTTQTEKEPKVETSFDKTQNFHWFRCRIEQTSSYVKVRRFCMGSASRALQHANMAKYLPEPASSSLSPSARLHRRPVKPVEGEREGEEAKDQRPTQEKAIAQVY
ncbi:unnamed protein product [Nesidiocoris tenuis]|uniref:Uncharacterized protein n=1 Tax=Nesidiocoris tenuis TaxID=355587 RepID=A0A6H5GQ60_9HEMI|nr:unnamed protein product [Nesidiocoris tenuis]